MSKGGKEEKKRTKWTTQSYRLAKWKESRLALLVTLRVSRIDQVTERHRQASNSKGRNVGNPDVLSSQYRPKRMLGSGIVSSMLVGKVTALSRKEITHSMSRDYPHPKHGSKSQCPFRKSIRREASLLKNPNETAFENKTKSELIKRGLCRLGSCRSKYMYTSCPLVS